MASPTWVRRQTGAKPETVPRKYRTTVSIVIVLTQLRDIGENADCLHGDILEEPIGLVLRRTQFIRPAFQLAGVLIFVLLFSTVSGAPNVGLAEPATVAPKPAAPDVINDPPATLDFSDLPSPRVRAQAAMIYNPATHEILWESRGHDRRSVASITKVVTSLVFLEQDPDLTRDVVIAGRDVRRASTSYLRRGERIQLRDVLHLALVASDNAAARILARVSPWGTEGFVEQMNRKASELGLRSTSFVDPAGLKVGNLSTAYDVSRLIAHAIEQPEIARIMGKESYSLRTSRRRLTVRNTNRLLMGRLEVQGGKTGYIDASGYCLATVVNVPGTGPLSVVVLGARSNSERFAEVRRLTDWVSKHGRSLVAPTVLRAN